MANLLKYLQYSAKYFYKKYPVEITYFVTARCNFKCRHCFNDFDPSRKELTLEEVREFTRNTPRFLRLLISGGEPFLRKDLHQICYEFYRNCKVKHISIPTNASLPEIIEKQTEQLLADCPDAFINISLSLDELGEKRDSIVGMKDTFAKFNETLDRLSNLKTRYDNLGIGVITTHTRSNENDLKDIYKYTQGKPVDNFGFNLVRGKTRCGDELGIDINKYAEMAEILRYDRKRFNFPLAILYLAKKSLLFRIVQKIIQDNQYQIPCYAAKLHYVIDETGNVYPCETFMFSDNKCTIANLRDNNYDFKKICLSDKAKEARKRIRETKCFCTHECYLSTSILFNIRLLPRLLREVMILKNNMKKQCKRPAWHPLGDAG